MPSLTGVAVKVTGFPWHTGFDDAVMDTLTGNSILTFIVIALDVTVLLEVQDALDVI